MNNLNAIKFVNETVRPLAEQLEALSAKLAVMRTEWYGGQNNNFSVANDPVEDNREGEGVSRLVCGDVTNFIAQALKTAPGEVGAWNAEIIHKPTVRQFSAS